MKHPATAFSTKKALLTHALKLHVPGKQNQHPYQLMVYVDDMEMKKQHCSCIAE